jgi:hypothetical protein
MQFLQGTTKTKSQALREAAQRITRCGLHKGAMWPGAGSGVRYTDGTPCCIAGAVALALNPYDPRSARNVVQTGFVLAAVDRHLYYSLPDGSPHSAVAWSDQPDRTADDVIAALIQAAEDVDNGR